MISETVNESDININMQYQNLSIYDNGQPFEVFQNEETTKNPNIDGKALRMMQKMGYKQGSGLGKSEQGITKIIDINYQHGKRGLGLKLKCIEDTLKTWDFSIEEVNVKENLIWLKNEEAADYTEEEMITWIKEGEHITDIKTQSEFCDGEILNNVVNAKDIFDEMDIIELCQARAKSNPFETIRSAFFMNRAALKMANIDAVTNYMFTDVDKNETFQNHEGPYYFADVCAGPGGFTEYVLWRKQWHFKGFGLTLKDENDFKLGDSTCACPASFQGLYGKDDDGNVCSPENIMDFKEKVMHETDMHGVHFMMSDGGFSVEGNENFQEILSKSIYICQCLVALEIVRSHGHFVTKLFDVFTPFSVGILFLMFKCFEKVAILKPNSSRPANSERYFICSNLNRDHFYERVKRYFWFIVRRLWEIKDNNNIDVLEIVPLHILKGDKYFYNYIVNSNNTLAVRQTTGLKKLAAFCQNPTLVECRQEEYRRKCLEFWNLPDKSKTALPQLSALQLVNLVLDKPEILLVQPRRVDHIEAFNELISDVEDWYYFPLYSSQKTNNCNFYAGVSGKVYRLQKGKWIKINNIQLCRGTLLYGEFVKEKCVTRTGVNKETESTKYSLHIIDALYLGEKSLIDLSFFKRQDLIKLYCKSLNKEGIPLSVRIRPKISNRFSNISSDCLISSSKMNGTYCNLPLLGYKSISESFKTNSLLLLKMNSNQSFHWTYVLRVQIFIKDNEEINEDSLLLEHILSEVKEKS
ncbi:cap-specific mRNA (nucleoside-2'-O-)-methyltransferase 1 isoform X1 [Diabrotica undecimpunctata]|uniref:cap-specific mRNA (nucleoside-2'-O-)-methyltransferase 1 isoform X1 n=1 Tax=Diabrotica undecimpunctata TaxID=50387 RepID=UPI003B63F26E